MHGHGFGICSVNLNRSTIVACNARRQGPVQLQISSDYRPVREGRTSLRPTEAEGKLRGDVEEVMGRVAHLIEQLVGAGVGV
jgi:hypothetical protein